LVCCISYLWRKFLTLFAKVRLDRSAEREKGDILGGEGRTIHTSPFSPQGWFDSKDHGQDGAESHQKVAKLLVTTIGSHNRSNTIKSMNYCKPPGKGIVGGQTQTWHASRAAMMEFILAQVDQIGNLV
jgi:hypothetical protein